MAENTWVTLGLLNILFHPEIVEEKLPLHITIYNW